MLKREGIRRKVCFDRENATRDDFSDVFNYIEMLYNPKRRHSHANDVSLVALEKQYFNRLQRAW